MAKNVTEYTKEELEEKIVKIKAERERTAEALKKYEEELERRKQEVLLGVPLENIMLAHVGGIYKYAFVSEDSKLVFDRRIEEYVKALRKLAKGEPIDIKVLLPLLQKGWVSMDKNGRWYWYNIKPKEDGDIWYCFDDPDYVVIYLRCFNIKPAEDWRKSLMECGL